MTKLVQTTVDVGTEQLKPRWFFFQRRRPVDSIQEYWREKGRWWKQEPELHVYRVVSEGTLFELHYFPDTAQWVLHRMYD